MSKQETLETLRPASTLFARAEQQDETLRVVSRELRDAATLFASAASRMAAIQHEKTTLYSTRYKRYSVRAFASANRIDPDGAKARERDKKERQIARINEKLAKLREEIKTTA